MELMWPYLGGGALVLTLALFGYGLWRGRRNRNPGTGPLIARMYRVRALPRYQALARKRNRWLRIQLMCWVVAAVGAALTMSRWIGVDDQEKQIRTRDVILCLDVSGSMQEIDRDVINSYLALVDSLGDERIGFVMWDNTAVTAFPLTQDRAYIKQELQRAAKNIGHEIEGTDVGSGGSSLIGDGLASCVSRFDQMDQERSRTIVLATDNLLSGSPIYTLQQAMQLARHRQIMVFAIMPDNVPDEQTGEMARLVKQTSGQLLNIHPGRKANVAVISHEVKEQAKTALLALASHRAFDKPWYGATVLFAGTCGAMVARRLERS